MHGIAESCPKYFLQRDKTSPLCYLVLPGWETVFILFVYNNWMMG